MRNPLPFQGEVVCNQITKRLKKVWGKRCYNACMNASKAGLRQKLKAQRLKLSSEEVNRRSQKIADQVLEILNPPSSRLRGASMISILSMHTYMPLEKQKEIDSKLLLKAIWTNQPSIKTATWRQPLQKFESVWINSSAPPETVAEGYQYDLIIVPMLGFDDQAYRLGFGGGFYDSFLKTQTDALKVGLCYEFGHVDFTPEPHDVSLDMVITENKIYRF